MLKSLIFTLTVFFSVSVCGQKHWQMIEEGNHTVQEIQQVAEKYFQGKDKGKGSGFKQYKRWEYFALRDADLSGKVEWRKNAYNEISKFRSSNTKVKRSGPVLWEELGPTTRNPTSSWNPRVGRIECISVDVSNSSHILAGAPSGGAWMSKDAGVTWTPLTDKLSTLNMLGCLISPHNSDVYFIGTDQGIFKSDDGGATWSNVFSSSMIKIKAHPLDASILIGCGGSGVYRSVNGGDSWQQMTSGSFLDLEFHPTDPNHVYAAGRYNFFRSTNGGQTWTQVTAGSGGGYGRVAVSPAEPNSVWYLQASGNNYGSLSKSTNKGQSFSIINSSGTDYLNGYGWYGIDLAVSAQDPSRIYLGGMELFRSTNGGSSFSLYVPWLYSSAGSKYIHADIHALEWFGSNLYTGTDGGISISQNNEATFKNLSNGLNVRQFYKIGVCKTNPLIVTGGAQDNGTASTFGSGYAWREWLGADGMEAFVSWGNPNNQIGTSQNGSLYRTTNGGASQGGISGGDGNWVTPVEQHPTDADVFYVGYTSVSRYSFSSGSGQALGTPSGSGKCNELKISESNPLIMFASKGSTLSKSTNGGTSWTQLTTNLGSINYITIHPEDPNYIAVATSGSGKVYVSSNGGFTWTSQRLNLPGLSALCVAYEKGSAHGLYVGMYSGVYYIDDNMSGYVDYQDNLPNVQVNEIEINYVDNRIYAGTYGRGAWSAPTYGTSNQIDLTVTIDGSTNFCEGESVLLSAAQIDNYSYKWLKDGNYLIGRTTNSLTVTESGQYQVEITSEGEVGESEIIEVGVIAKAILPSVNDVLFCNAGDEVTLTAQNAINEIYWYSSASGLNPLHEGEDYSTVLTQSTTFYVQQSSVVNTQVFGGALDNSLSSGGNHAGDYGLVFDVFKNMRLKSVEVYAQGAGNRNFVLIDGNSNVLEDTVIHILDGKNRVELNWLIPQGSDYQIMCEKINSEDVNLYRNSAFSSFPFQIGNIMTITNGTATGVELEYYYYFYNWIIVEDQLNCPSERIAVEAALDVCTSVQELSRIGVNVYPNPSTDFINIEVIKDFETTTWDIVDIRGKIVLNGQLDKNQVVDVSQLSNGLYILRVMSAGEVYSSEIQKR